MAFLCGGLVGCENWPRARAGHVAGVHCERFHAAHLGQVHALRLLSALSPPLNRFFTHIHSQFYVRIAPEGTTASVQSNVRTQIHTEQHFAHSPPRLFAKNRRYASRIYMFSPLVVNLVIEMN